MTTPKFKTAFSPGYGEAVELAPGLTRITCQNPSPFTFYGTNTYLLGTKTLAIIDPGPENDAHFNAIVKAVDGRDVSRIIVTHTHADHSPLARRLKELTGAKTFAEGPHRAARPLNTGEINPLDASADMSFQPDVELAHGDVLTTGEWQLTALATPGHTANHMAFAWNHTDFLFPGDHVMAWSTSIVAPPDGSMSDYMASLNTLLEQPQTTYFPGHGGKLENAHAFVRALRAHRKMRELAIVDQIKKGKQTIPEIVSTIYQSTDKKLHRAAGLSVLAHLENLVEKGVVTTDGPARIDGRYIC